MADRDLTLRELNRATLARQVLLKRDTLVPGCATLPSGAYPQRRVF